MADAFVGPSPESAGAETTKAATCQATASMCATAVSRDSGWAAARSDP
jgi:hypothetical protein